MLNVLSREQLNLVMQKQHPAVTLLFPSHTNLVEDEDELLVGASSHHGLLHLQAAGPEGVSGIQHLENHVGHLQHLAELSVVGAAAPTVHSRNSFILHRRLKSLL